MTRKTNRAMYAPAPTSNTRRSWSTPSLIIASMTAVATRMTPRYTRLLVGFCGSSTAW
jgi:hypothetical protein